MTRRRWIADSWNDRSATLTGAHAEHLARVLRVQPGMEFDLVTGNRVVRAKVSGVSETEVQFLLGEEIQAVPPLPLTLLLAIFKFDRMEWAIEKATELGVARIVPIVARRTEKHLAKAAIARVERWRRIAREAAQQSRRSELMLIEDATAFETALEENGNAWRLLLSENEQVSGLRETVDAREAAPVYGSSSESRQQVQLAIGPEGGWTREEEQSFHQKGWTSVSLGPRILRAETAAIAATAIVAASLE